MKWDANKNQWVETKADKAKRLRYKRPALASMGYEAITTELYNIQNDCEEVKWFVNQDDETLLNAMDGDEDDLYEFKMAFAELSAKTDQLLDQLYDWEIQDEFDDCTVGLLGNRYRLVGYDGVEEDYFSLCGYDGTLATKEAGKRLMRHTKAEMISIIGQCQGILLAFLDIRQKHDYLSATMDILKGENTSILHVVKDIEELYDRIEGRAYPDVKDVEQLDKLIEGLPDRLWIE